jgi:hypothetical protein
MSEGEGGEGGGNEGGGGAPDLGAMLGGGSGGDPGGDPGGQPGGPAPIEWANGYDADVAAFIGNKGWDSPLKAVQSYQNLEKLHGKGADSLVAIPDWANGDQVAEFNARMGVLAEGSEFNTPEVAVGENVLEADVLQAASVAMGHRPDQHEAFAKWAGEYLSSVNQANTEAIETRDVAEQVSLEKEWGSALETKTKAATRAVERFGIAAEDISLIQKEWGYAKTMKFLAGIGTGLGEHQRGDENDPPGGPPNSGLTPAEAHARLKEQNQDSAFYAKLQAGDRTAVAEREALKTIAYRREG